MENRDERRGNGVFLGIVGVATLIVAIIGASFAYFSIQAGSANDAVNLTAYEFSATLSMQEVSPSDAKLIPVNPNGIVEGADEPYDTNLSYALNVDNFNTNREKCIDDNGFKVCALYELTVTNNGSQQVEFAGAITTTENSNESNRTGAEPFSNLTYSAVTKTGDSYALSGTPVPLAANVDGTTSIGSLTVPAGQSRTTYMLIYLNENDDQSAEMGATYKGQITYTSTEGAGNKLTGTFRVS